MQKTVIIFGLFWMFFGLSAQENIETFGIERDSIILRSKLILPDNDLKYSPDINGAENGSLILDVNSELSKPDYNPFIFSTGHLLSRPYGYSFDSGFSGKDMFGVTNRLKLGDFVAANFNVYIASSYFGYFQPYRYTNASAELNLILRVHERVQLVGISKISVREGIDPRVPSLMNDANIIGGGVQFKVTEKFGVGFGVTSSYYKGNWMNRPYLMPVAY